MNSNRMFLSVLLLMVLIYGVTSLLVPKGLNPNVIEDLEANYHNLKSLYQKAVQLKDLLPEEDLSSISKFLEDFKNCVDGYEYQENRSGLLLQKIYRKFQGMKSVVDPADNPILNERLLKEQAQDLQKLVQELEAKIGGIKADPMMFSKEKADDLYRIIQMLKEKYSPLSDTVEDSYAAKQAKESKMSQVDLLSRLKMELEAKLESVKSDKQSKNYSLEITEDAIRDLKKEIADIQKQIQDLEKPKSSGSENENITNKTFHYIFLVDTSIRKESQKILQEVDSNIESLKISRESGKDVFSLITLDKEVRTLAQRLPITMNSRLDLKKIKTESHQIQFEKGLEKASHLLKNYGNKEEIPVFILYTDGMRWYYESEPVLAEEKRFEGFIWWIWNSLVDLFYRFVFKDWFLKPMKESDIHDLKKLLADFSERFADRNLTGFVSGTTSQNQGILREFAKALNKNEIVLQTTIGENYEYFNLARATEVFPQIFKTLSFAEKGPMSREFLQEQIRKKIQKENEEMEREREILGKDDWKNFDKNKLFKERDDLEKKRSELLQRKVSIQFDLENFAIEIEKLQSEISFIENTLNSLKEEIQLTNEKSFEREKMKKESVKLEAKNAVIRTHLEILEQLTKTVQARDHNILAIFEYATTFSKEFLASSEIIFQSDKISNYDLLIVFYKDRLGLYRSDIENMEKICKFWLGDSYDQEMIRDFFMLINPRDLVENELETVEVREVIESSGRKNLDHLKEKYEELYLTLRKKISASKTKQKMQIMDSQRSEVRTLFSLDFMKLMEKLDKKIYMMY